MISYFSLDSIIMRNVIISAIYNLTMQSRTMYMLLFAEYVSRSTILNRCILITSPYIDYEKVNYNQKSKEVNLKK